MEAVRRRSHWQIPILNREGRVVDWTDAPPQPSGRMLRHPEAEKILGGRIGCAFVEIVDRALAQKAGAPPQWDERWRCIAIVPSDLSAKGPLTVGPSGRD